MSEDFKVFPDSNDEFEQKVYDRLSAKPGIDRVYFPEDEILHGSDLNESNSISEKKSKEIGDLVASDGDRLSGAEVIVEKDASAVTITAGEIYVDGARQEISEKTLTSVPMTGLVSIGFTLEKQTITHENDPDYLGVHEGSEGFEEPGAVRTKKVAEWSLPQNAMGKPFYAYAEILNGEVVSQDAPPSLSGVNQQIGRYVTSTHGNFSSDGNYITALGLTQEGQNFSIEAGYAWINGKDVFRAVANRHIEAEDPELVTVDAEIHTYVDDNGSAKILLNRNPIKSVEFVTVTKERTVTISRGVGDLFDALPDNGVSQILSVTQGATTYVEGTDFRLTGDQVEWLSGGAKPSDGTTYDVVYYYRDDETPSDITNTHITVSNGVDGQQVIVRYQYALPRYDCLCMDNNGRIIYLKGTSTATAPLAPPVPDELLKLGEIHNTFAGVPKVVNNGTRNIPFDSIQRAFDMALDTRRISLQNRGQNGVAIRSQGRPTGSFVDPLIDDSVRDAGAAQTAAVNEGFIHLAMDRELVNINLGSMQMLDFVEEEVVKNDFSTGCEKINPYQSFSPLPAIMSLTPSQDFWTETQTNWLSQQTRFFGVGNSQRQVNTEILRSSTEQDVENLRQIPVNFRIEQLGVGETLTSLTFDGIDVTPSGLAADTSGVIFGSFTIPANVSAGRKNVSAVTGSGTRCSAVFTGQGTLEIVSLQRVNTVQRFQVEPIQRWDSDEDGAIDPQAQSWSLDRGRHVSSVDLKFCAIGDPNEPVILEFVTSSNGHPTREVIAQTEISMVGVQVNQTVRFSLNTPFYVPANTELWFVVKTNDDTHSISVSTLGEFDSAKQQHAQQAYTVGVRASSSNAISYTIHQKSDITFTLNSPRFGPLEKRVDLGTHNVSDVSDIIVGSSVRLPTSQTEVFYELTFGDENPILVRPNQPYSRDSFFSGDLTVTLVIRGTDLASPIVGQDVVLILGTLRTSGTYISPSFPVGGNKEVFAGLSANLPSGSTVKVELDAVDGNWVDVSETSNTAISQGFFEKEFVESDITLNPEGRMRITITGTPASRPLVADIYAFSR